jgi:hypothetical protein
MYCDATLTSSAHCHDFGILWAVFYTFYVCYLEDAAMRKRTNEAEIMTSVPV